MIRRYPVPLKPPLWARSGHAQTLLGHLLPSAGRRFRPDTDEHHEVELPDGERLLVYARPGTSGVRVHLFHGLSGDANSEYMRRTAAALARDGHGIWAVNHRGCGDGEGLAYRPYHSGKVQDMAAVLAASRADAQGDRHVVVGFSLSANMALLLAASPDLPQPDGILAINPPADLLRASVAIGRGLSRLYELRFVVRLRRAIRHRARIGKLSRDYHIPLSASLLEFDDLFTAPECGFESGRDYYEKCSSITHLEAIRTPSVILTASDDPFVSPAIFEDAPMSDRVFTHIEPVGGHTGYLAKKGLGWTRWLDGAARHYVRELG